MEKKLLIILGSLGRGGAERVISLISNYCHSRGWQVKIGLLLFNDVEYPIDSAIEVIDLSGQGQSRIKRLPLWLAGIRKLAKEYKPDVILSFAARINVIVQLACFGLRKKIIVSERNDPFMDGRSRFVDLMTTLLYPMARAVVFQTQRAQSYFKKLRLKNALIITNPISAACLAGERTPGKIVTAGRFTAQKNQKLLLDAFFHVQKEFPEASLWLYGRGELENDLRSQAAALGIAEKVHFEGNVSDLHRRIADANMFVLPSDYEGLSNALLEAMMMGIPCIATDCAGCDEYIRDHENGLLVHVGDGSALAEAMKELLARPELADKLASASMADSAAFEQNTVLEKWLSLFEGVRKS